MSSQREKPMKREARLLLEKAKHSLLLSIETFNRPFDIGRVPTSLILLDHAFEMLLKSAILHRDGRIREKRANQTLGFDACVRVAFSDGNLKFLDQNQALTLQTINGLRDAAQHYLLDISEQQLYAHAQAGITLFRDLLKSVFNEDLIDHLPARVLPVSVEPPNDIAVLFEAETAAIIKLLQPGRRRRIDAQSRLRPLAIMDATMKGERIQPTNAELARMAKELASGRKWQDIFPGVAAIEFTTAGTGPSIELRLSKKKGVPVELVPAGTPDASVVAVKRVDELGFYQFSTKQLAAKSGIAMHMALAVIDHLKLQEHSDYFKLVVVGSQSFKRYSGNALQRIQAELPKLNQANIWDAYKKAHFGKKKHDAPEEPRWKR